MISYIAPMGNLKELLILTLICKFQQSSFLMMQTIEGEKGLSAMTAVSTRICNPGQWLELSLLHYKRGGLQKDELKLPWDLTHFEMTCITVKGLFHSHAVCEGGGCSGEKTLSLNYSHYLIKNDFQLCMVTIDPSKFLIVKSNYCPRNLHSWLQQIFLHWKIYPVLTSKH